VASEHSRSMAGRSARLALRKPVRLASSRWTRVSTWARTPGRRSIDEYDAKMPFKFTGTLRKLEIKLGPDQLTPKEKAENEAFRRDRALAAQ